MMLLQRLCDDPLQLAVDRAELVGSPLLHRLHGLGIHPEQKGLGTIVFLFRHNHLSNDSRKVRLKMPSLAIHLS